MKFFKLGMVMSAALLLGNMSANAHDGAMGVVKDRMEMMKQLGGVMKMVVPVVKGQKPFDAARIKQQGMIIQDNSGKKLLEKFPEGSTDNVSEARPEIWKNWGDFSKIAMELNGLGKSIAENPTEKNLKASFGKIGATCSSCHKQFRAKK